MTPIEKLRDEINVLEQKQDEALNRASVYTGSGEDGSTDPEVEKAHAEVQSFAKQIEAKRLEIKRLGGDPLEGFVGASPAE